MSSAKGLGLCTAKRQAHSRPSPLRPTNLGTAWKGSKVHLPFLVNYNDKPFGKTNAGVDMTFNFSKLVAHAAKTRKLCAGTIIGSGTVSNQDKDGGPGKKVEDGGLGYSCIAEIRMIETIQNGKATTSFMKFGDRVSVEMNDKKGNSIFGKIDHIVEKNKK